MIPYVVKGQLDSVQKELEIKIANASSERTSISYAELVALKHNRQLVVGKEYRITNFCTTILEDYSGEDASFSLSPYKSAEHPFDVIVKAIGKDKLSFEAKAALHEGDEYFADQKLDTWKLSYELELAEDDAGRFEIPSVDYIIESWDTGSAAKFVGEFNDGPTWMPHYYRWSSDPNWPEYDLCGDKREPEVGDPVYYAENLTGEEPPEEYPSIILFKKVREYTGRILFMEDENGNAANYDFKNIMTHIRAAINDISFYPDLRDRYYFLFDGGKDEAIDLSINTSGRCYSNRILVDETSTNTTRDTNPTGFYRGAMDIGTNFIIAGTISNITINKGFDGYATQKIVICSLKGSTAGIARQMNIGARCQNILLFHTTQGVNIGDDTSQVTIEGQCNGHINIGAGCKNINLSPYKGGTSKTSGNSSINIGDNCLNVTLGDAANRAYVTSGVTIGNRAVDILLPCLIYSLHIGDMAKSITADEPNSDGKFVTLNAISLGERCETITFKLADSRGNSYQAITLHDKVKSVTFAQNNTGKGPCQVTNVFNLEFAPGYSGGTISDARFDPVGTTNENKGVTKFIVDAEGNSIMYWYSSGITISGKKWNTSSKTWEAL